MQGSRGQSAADGRDVGAAARPTRTRSTRPVAHHRRRIRQQDRGEMPLKPAPAGRLLMRVVLVAAALAGVLLLVGALDGAFAQAGPFGAPRSQARAVPIGGVLGWIFARQAEFYRALSGSIRAAKADGSAAWALFAIAFAYGVFHAAGPGHGKAVISSYLVANEETWKRGVVLSFASALLQALVAVAIVGIAAALLGATAKMMGDTVRVIETVSYLLIIAVGLRLLWVKGKGFLREARNLSRPLHAVGAAVTPPHDHKHHDDGHGHDHHDHAHHDHDHGHDDDHHHDHDH